MPNTRGRFVASALASLFVLNVFVGLVPTAEATVTYSDLVVTVLVDNVDASTPAAPIAGNQSVVRIAATGSIDGDQLTECLTEPVITATANLAALGFGISESLGTGTVAGDPGGPWTFEFTKDFTMNTGDATSLDGTATPIVVTFDSPDPCDQNATASGPNVKVDRRPPGGSISMSVGRTVPSTPVSDPIIIGDSLLVNITAGAGATSARGDLRQILGGTGETSLTLGAPQPYVFTTVDNSNTNIPRVYLTDARGNSISADYTGAVDADAPDFEEADILLTPLVGGQVYLNITKPAAPDVPAAHSGYVVVITGGPGSPRWLTTNSSDPDHHLVAEAETGGVIPFLLPANFFTLTTPPTTHSISVRLRDTAGNLAGPFSKDVGPALAPTFVSIVPKPPILNEWPDIIGTWISGEPLGASDTARFTWQLQRVSDFLHWSGSGSSFVAPSGSTTFNADVVTPASGASASTGSFAISKLRTSGGAIPNGTYRLWLNLSNAAGSYSAPDSFTVLFDNGRPVLSAAANTNRLVFPANGNIQQGQNVTFNVTVNDNLAGIDTARDFAFKLVHNLAPNRANVTTLDSLSPIVYCRPNVNNATCRTLGTGSIAANSFSWNVSVVFPTVALGSYRANVTATDLAGNVMLGNFAEFPPTGVALANSLNYIPRVTLGKNATDVPFADERGLRFNIYAAFDGTRSFRPDESCTSNGNVCRVDTIEVFGSGSPSAATPGAGGSSTTPSLYAESHDRAGPSAYVEGDGRMWFDYSKDPGQFVTIPASLSANNMYVKAVARAPTSATGTALQVETGWIRVRTGAAPLAYNSIFPLDNSSGVFFSGAPWKINVSTVFEQSGLSGAPTLFYTFQDVATGQYHRFDRGSFETLTPATANVPRNVTVPLQSVAVGTGGLYWMNISNDWIDPALKRQTVTIPRGEYAIHLTVRAFNDSNSPPIAVLDRMIAVETNPFTVALDDASLGFPQPEIFAGRAVPRSFNASFKVTHGFANLTPNNVSIQLEATAASGARYVTSPGAATFQATLKNLDFAPENFTTFGNWTLTLPQNATDGSRYTLIVTAIGQGAPASTATSGRKDVRVDDAPPATRLDVALSSRSGDERAWELNMSGTSEDLGSGVKTIEARLFNVEANSTFVWNSVYDQNGSGHWDAGLLDSWLTSDLARARDGTYVRNVAVGRTGGDNVVTWGIFNHTRPRLEAGGTQNTTSPIFPGIGFERNSTYVVEVRARDHLGKLSEVESFTVKFDRISPKVGSRVTGPSTVSWHGSGLLWVNVSDANNCVKRVSLVNATGAPVAANFTSPFRTPAGAPLADCRAGANTWQLNLSEHPIATDTIGVVSYGVEVEDTSGRVTQDLRTLNITVIDTQRALVQFLRVDPPIAQAGTYGKVVAEIFENDGIDRVVAFLHKLNGSRIERSYGQVNMHAADDVASNGTGNYFAQTNTDFNITDLQVGEYLWEVRAYDRHWNVSCTGELPCHQRSILMLVSTEGAPFISLETPTNGTTVLNATPTLVWHITDRNLAGNNIVVQAGANGTLAPVNATIAPLPRINNQSVGFSVTFSPPRINASNFSAKVTAVSTFTTEYAWDFAVDGIAPIVTANATGTLNLTGRTYAVTGTRIALSARDNETSVAALQYSVNGAPYQTYTTPIQPAGTEGEWQLDYRARDAAGNLASGTLTLHLDAAGPTITVAQHGDQVLLTVTDAGVGVDENNVTVHYAYGNASSFSVMKASKVAGNSFRAQLPGNSSDTGLRYWFDAKDTLGNVGTRFSAADPHVIAPNEGPSDLPPVVSITSPLDNAKARDKVELKWDARDPEGADLTITIGLREPQNIGSVLQAAGPNSGSFTVDVSKKAAGAYTLVVTASDGVNSGQDTVSFTVERGDLISCVKCPPANATAGTEVTFTVRIDPVDKVLAGATFVLMKDGVAVANGTLRSVQGVWSGVVKPTEPGSYKVLVTARYADGTSEPAKELAAFTVTGGGKTPEKNVFAKLVDWLGGSATTAIRGNAGTPTNPPIPGSLVLIVAIGVVTAALAAYGAFGRWRK